MPLFTVPFEPLALLAALALGGCVAWSCFEFRMRRAVEQSALSERRRIARDLHDHVAQDLAFVSMRSQRLAELSADENVEQLAATCVLTLRRARGMIDALMEDRSSGGSEIETAATPPLHVAVGAMAGELAARVGAELRLDLDPRAEPSPRLRHELLGILHEAMSNALRHGRANALSIELSCETGLLRMRVLDDGAGFDIDDLRRTPRGYGLLNMIERAREARGDLRLSSQPGVGTELEVTLPSALASVS
jgi:NarL family two-component system sensor histidine kinase LiaS